MYLSRTSLEAFNPYSPNHNCSKHLDFFLKKIRFDISCESSEMKCYILSFFFFFFFQKKKKKKNRMLYSFKKNI